MQRINKNTNNQIKYKKSKNIKNTQQCKKYKNSVKSKIRKVQKMQEFKKCNMLMSVDFVELCEMQRFIAVSALVSCMFAGFLRFLFV